MNDAHMTVAVAMLNLDIGSEYLNLNHVIRVRVESESKVKVWFSDGSAEYFKDSKAEIIARWYRQENVIPLELMSEEELEEIDRTRSEIDRIPSKMERVFGAR